MILYYIVTMRTDTCVLWTCVLWNIRCICYTYMIWICWLLYVYVTVYFGNRWLPYTWTFVYDGISDWYVMVRYWLYIVLHDTTTTNLYDVCMMFVWCLYDVVMMVCGVFMYLFGVLRMLECDVWMLDILVKYTCMYCYIVVIRLHCIVWFTLYNCNLITAYTWL